MHQLSLRYTFNLMGSVMAVCLMTAMSSAALAFVDGECRPDRLKQAFFGETHLHTSMSHDASVRLVPTTPREAYAFAKGERPIYLVDENGFIDQANPIKIDRPLDWGAVTDHSEYFTEMGLCKRDEIENAGEPNREVLNSLECRILTGSYWRPLSEEEERFNLPGDAMSTVVDGVLGFIGTISVRPSSRNAHLPIGEDPDDTLWKEMQAAAEEANDPCTFTSFIGYEITSAPSGVNWHRNVIFANDQVIDFPITAIDLAHKESDDPYEIPPRYLGPPNITELWDGLDDQCLNNEDKPECDVLTIPHNSNLGGGLYFMGNEYVPPLFFDPPGSTDKEQREHAEQRQRFEPLVEIYQAKGSSECRWDPRENNGAGGGVDTSDEFCDFELTDAGSIAATTTDLNSPRMSVNEINPKSYVRNVLKDGLRLKQKLKVNPFKLGILAASDSHNGDMGWRPEDERYSGHSGIKDVNPVSSGVIQGSSGGLSVVWAEENTRESIFAALKRREVYGTSGTRIRVRFYGGWDFSELSCDSGTALFEAGHDKGVPMGGEMISDPAPLGISQQPWFIVHAQMDDFEGGPQTPLDRIQIIKGWVDRFGRTHEKVIHVVGDIDTDTRMVDQPGHETLCGVYEDLEFDPAQPAFYYVRVLEKPVYRYSTRYCQVNFGVDPTSSNCQTQLDSLGPIDAGKATKCCSNETTVPIVQPVIQERAWTSPIWYTPPHLEES